MVRADTVLRKCLQLTGGRVAHVGGPSVALGHRRVGVADCANGPIARDFGDDGRGGNRGMRRIRFDDALVWDIAVPVKKCVIPVDDNMNGQRFERVQCARENRTPRPRKRVMI